MWMAECIANWTGLITEGKRIEPPFFTDADWGVTKVGGETIDFVTDQDPWWADDDTDIEYVYLHLLHTHQTTTLTPTQISDGWKSHINDFIFVSNAKARELMDGGVVPPGTSLPAANGLWLRIDAQLTTEIFGAFAPGMPEAAVQMADLPISTTARGHAALASQFHVILYSLATQVPPGLTGAESVEWLVKRAAAYMPRESKTLDIVNFVLTDYKQNPDKNDWESTRDKIYQRYQANPSVIGYTYQNWTESSINFAMSVACLLYGQGDLKRTIQIGTLGGWDSDNPTATIAGLLGLMMGTDAVISAFAPEQISDRFWIYRTRDNLPDYLPGDSEAEDTFSMMAARMTPIVEQAIVEAGGVADTLNGQWILPPVVEPAPSRVPQVETWLRSANNQVAGAGGEVTGSSSVIGAPPDPASTFGRANPDRIVSGMEFDYSGREQFLTTRPFFSTQNAGLTPGAAVTLTVTYDRDVQAERVRFVEGDHFGNLGADGGWFEDLQWEVRIGGQWQVVPVGPGGAELSEPLDSTRPFQIIDLILPNPVMVSGVRISGVAGGSALTGPFVTCSQLDVFSSPFSPTIRGFDLNGDGLLDFFDLLHQINFPADLDGDGEAGLYDLQYLINAIVAAGPQ